MKVLGIDPGFGRMGWAVVEGNRSKQVVVEWGCLETSPKDSLEERLVEIHEHVVELCEEYKPDEAAVEDLFYFKNQKTVIGVGQARGVIVLALAQKKVAVYHYTPLQIKQAVVGYGKADKKQVQFMVKNLLKLKSVPKQDDTADATAVALTHMFTDKRLRK